MTGAAGGLDLLAQQAFTRLGNRATFLHGKQADAAELGSMRSMVTSGCPRRQRISLRVGLGLILAYVALNALLLCAEPWIVYHPASPNQLWIERPTADIEDVYLTSADGTSLHSWWCRVATGRRALLLLHGNSGNVPQCSGMAVDLREALDANVLLLDYPGFGKSGGTPTEQGCYDAAEGAYRWLRQRRFAARDIIIFGDSFGGAVAVDLAARQDHLALVLVKTFTSLPDVGRQRYPFVAATMLMRNRFDSASKISQCRRPVFIAHGTADTEVPFAMGERLYELANEPKVFEPIPGMGHFEALPASFYSALKRFVDGVE
jgi:hypothetical protein